MSRCLGERQVTLGRRVALWFREYLSKSPGREDIRTRLSFPCFQRIENAWCPLLMAMVESLDVKIVRRSSDQAERKRSPELRRHRKGKTAASNRTNPVLRDGHPRSGRCPSGDRGRSRVGPRVS